LTPSQCNGLSALTGEVTRSSRSSRKDKAQVVRAGEGDRKGERRVPRCPFLPEGRGHVLFNGNGKGKRKNLHGHGFRPSTWMRKAGYPDAGRYSIILNDLSELAEPFGLVVAGSHVQHRDWKTLQELRAIPS